MLNENNLGSKSGIVNPQIGQAFLSLYNFSLSLIMILINPSPHLEAISISSNNLSLISSPLFLILSMTISIVCFLFLSKVSSLASGSSVLINSLSILSLVNPFFANFSNTF